MSEYNTRKDETRQRILLQLQESLNHHLSAKMPLDLVLEIYETYSYKERFEQHYTHTCELGQLTKIVLGDLYETHQN